MICIFFMTKETVKRDKRYEICWLHYKWLSLYRTFTLCRFICFRSCIQRVTLLGGIMRNWRWMTSCSSIGKTSIIQNQLAHIFQSVLRKESYLIILNDLQCEGHNCLYFPSILCILQSPRSIRWRIGESSKIVDHLISKEAWRFTDVP